LFFYKLNFVGLYITEKLYDEFLAFTGGARSLKGQDPEEVLLCIISGTKMFITSTSS
jgi:hypothetical protein